MFIIWGWRAVKAVLGIGTFYCPRCQGDRGYRHISARRWFTLFFIPVIPLKSLGSFVECDTCHGTFVEGVLEAPTVALFEHSLGLATRASVAHLVALLAGSPGAVEGAMGELVHRAGVPQAYDEAALRADVAAFADRSLALRYVAPLATTMSIDGREDFVRRLVAFAARLSAVDHLGEPIAAFAAELQLSPAHLAGIREQVASGTWGQA